MNNKNIIFAIPDTILRPIPLIAFLFCKKQNKSVIVFTQKIGNDILHYKEYYLLNSNNYLFSEIPLGIVSNSEVDAKIYLPRMSGRGKFKKIRQEYIKYQKNNFLTKKGPKILLHCDENNSCISNTIDRISLDDGSFENLNVNINIGLVIFENIDRFVHSTYSTQIFLKWISPFLKKDLQVIFHFSNPLSKYIQILKEQTNSYVLQFGPSLLRYNDELKKASISYFNTKSINIDEKKFIDKYNIDRSSYYTNKTEIELSTPPLTIGNIDEYFWRSRSLLSKIDEKSLINKRQYYPLINILFKMHNLIINPSKYKETFYDPNIGYRYYTISNIIEKIKESISDELVVNKIYFEDLISEIYSLYLELKECKRYGEKDTYSRIAKDYYILHLITELTNNKEDKINIVIATYSPIERTILKTEIEKLGFKNIFDIEYIGRLSKKYFDRAKTTLILPGPLRLKHFPELLQPYHKIIMITYNGKNNEIGNDQINLCYTYSQQREDQAMNYLDEIYTDIGIHKNGIFKDYYQRKNEFKEKDTCDTNGVEIKEEGEDPLIIRIKKMLTTRNNQISNEYLQENEDAERIEQKIIEYERENTISPIEETNEYYQVILVKFNDNIKMIRNLPINQSYLYLKNIDDEVQEGYPADFIIGNFIILIGNDEKKTFLDTIIEIFGLEDSVNKRLLTMWRDKLRNFINNKNLTYASSHRMFKEYGGNISYPEFLHWVKGNVIGPVDPNDLVILGKMMDDEELIENYELINQEVEDLRYIHKITGRRVHKIIKEVLKGEFNQSELSLEEYLLYDQIHNNIYEVVDIEHIFKEEE